MKKLVLLYMACASFNVTHAQDLHIYSGTVPVIDGIISPGEWNDSDSCQIAISGSLKVTVRFKHDGSNLYFVYYNHLESAVRCPEVNLDINNSKSTSWQGDDWWFHASGTDCENNGAPNVYSDCLAVQPDWEAVPNFVSGGANEDTVEMRLPFSKIGFAYSGGIDTIGLALDVTNTFSAWNMYPSTATVNDPSTWANGIFYNYAAGIKDTGKPGDEIVLYPNPAAGQFFISGQNSHGKIRVYDITGKMVGEQTVSAFPAVVDASVLSPGVYMVQVGGACFKLVKK
ncbi:MAG TPA: T9SS type A sorting domain-containing protein [Flavobacteriales bacterium]|nr:T9SS type A sorting domain-containing protein [Flavobacteriales bacterium]